MPALQPSGICEGRRARPGQGQAEGRGSAVLGPHDDTEEPGEMERRPRLPRGALKLGPANLSL